MPGAARRTFTAISTSGKGRFRGARRIALTMRTTSSSGLGRVGTVQAAASIPLGSTVIGGPWTIVRNGAAAMSETAFIAMPCRAQRRTTPSARTAYAALSRTQCQVMTVGIFSSEVSTAASVANGLTTPMWICATSNRRS